MPPARREVVDARHVRESDYATIVQTDALPACSLERGACHRLGMWRMLGAQASASAARACDNLGRATTDRISRSPSPEALISPYRLLQLTEPARTRARVCLENACDFGRRGNARLRPHPHRHNRQSRI